MAQDFRNVLKSATGTVVVPVLVAGDYDALIGIRCCNIVATTILIELIQGGAKIVMASGDTLNVKSDTASSLDVVMSYIDTISS